LFAAIAVVNLVFVIFVVPETKGKSLEAIEQLYTKKKNNEQEMNYL
jgi:hypothetical protein